MSLEEARQRNNEIKEQIAKVIDPKAKKKEWQAISDGSKLFDTIAQDWYTERKTYLAPSTFNRDYSAYERDVTPVIGQ